METESLSVSVREETGKGAARKLRAAGRVPAVIYRGGGEAVSITVDPSELEAVFRRTANRNTVLKLDVAGASHLCLIKDIQRHPVSRRFEHIDFYEVREDEPVRVTVPVKPVGTPEGVRMGGRLQLVRRNVDLLCKPADIPAALPVDVADLKIGKFVRVSQVAAPEGCQIVYKGDFNIVQVLGKRGAGKAEAGAGA